MTATTKFVGSGSTAARGGSSVSWSNAANITADDNTDAVAGDLQNGGYTNYLVGTMSGNEFAIPADHIIQGVKIEFEHTTNGTADGTQVVDSIHLVTSLGNGDDKGDQADITTTTRTLRTYGGPNDRHGLDLTPAVINDGGLGFWLSIAEGTGSGNGKQARVDFFRITVYHAPGLLAGKASITGSGKAVSFIATMSAAKASITGVGKSVAFRNIERLEANKASITGVGKGVAFVTHQDWLADQTAHRVVLINLTSADTGVHRIGSETYITGAADTPAHTIYHARVVSSVRLRKRLGGLFGSESAFTAASVTVLDPDGELDDWLYERWTDIEILHGDKTWPLSRFRTEFSGKLKELEADLEHKYFETEDKNVLLKRPIQYVPMIEGPEFGELAPLCYGYAKNVKPAIDQLENNAEFWVHEGNTVEDVAVARYLNQAVSTSPAIVKPPTLNINHAFELLGDPEALVTADVKGAKNAAGVWVTKPGEILQEALTRDVNYHAGMVLGGSLSPATIQLGPPASDVDDFYVGDGVTFGVAGDPDKSESGKGVASDYDGTTHTVTLDSWDGGAPPAAPASGDLWRTGFDDGPTMRAGPLDPAELNTTSFGQVDTDLPYDCGVYVDDKRSTEEFIRTMLGPAGHWHFNGPGRLSVGVLKDPAGETADYTLDEKQIDGERQPRQVKRPPPAWRIRLGHDKNHTVARESAAGTLDMDRAAWVQKPYRWHNRQDPKIKEKNANARDLEIETVINTAADGKTEIDRVWPLFSVQRYSHFYPAFEEPLGWQLGRVVEVTDARYGFDAGKNATFIGLEAELLDCTTEVEMWA